MPSQRQLWRTAAQRVVVWLERGKKDGHWILFDGKQVFHPWSESKCIKTTCTWKIGDLSGKPSLQGVPRKLPWGHDYSTNWALWTNQTSEQVVVHTMTSGAEYILHQKPWPPHLLFHFQETASDRAESNAFRLGDRCWVKWQENDLA